MPVFSKIRGFFSRHRNKFIVGGVLVTGTIFLAKYGQQKLKEWQEREMMEFMERTRKQQHFESIKRTCNQTILNIFAALSEALNNSIDTDSIIAELRNNSGNKLETWNTLKVLLFTKIGCIIYSTVILIITLRVQMNLIGGYLYKDPNSISTEMQQQYLSVCENLMNQGVEKLEKLIQEKCEKILAPVDLKKQFKISDIEAIFWSLQTAVTGDEENPVEKLKDYIIPFYDDMTNNDEIYNSLIRDTIDFLESEEVKSMMMQCINQGFILLDDLLAEFYGANGTNGIQIKEIPSTSTNSDFVNIFDVKKPLAKLLPIFNGLLLKSSFPDKYVQQLIVNDKLQTLGANIYESLL